LDRDDVRVEVNYENGVYVVWVYVYVLPHDGIYARINKGIDTVRLKKEINEFFTLDELYVYYKIMG
jgi:hypothetical protein